MFEVKPVVRSIKIFKESVVKALANKDIADNPEMDGKWETVEEPEMPMDRRITEWAESENAVVVDVFVNTYYESSTPGEYTINTTYIVAYMPFESYMQFNRSMALVTRNALHPRDPNRQILGRHVEQVPTNIRPPMAKGANPWQTLPTPENIRAEATEAAKPAPPIKPRKPKLPPAFQQ